MVVLRQIASCERGCRFRVPCEEAICVFFDQFREWFPPVPWRRESLHILLECGPLHTQTLVELDEDAPQTRPSVNQEDVLIFCGTWFRMGIESFLLLCQKYFSVCNATQRAATFIQIVTFLSQMRMWSRVEFVCVGGRRSGGRRNDDQDYDDGELSALFSYCIFIVNVFVYAFVRFSRRTQILVGWRVFLFFFFSPKTQHSELSTLFSYRIWSTFLCLFLWNWVHVLETTA